MKRNKNTQDQYDYEDENINECVEKIEEDSTIKSDLEQKTPRRGRKSKTDTKYYVNNSELATEIKKYQKTRNN